VTGVEKKPWLLLKLAWEDQPEPVDLAVAGEEVWLFFYSCVRFPKAFGRKTAMFWGLGAVSTDMAGATSVK